VPSFVQNAFNLAVEIGEQFRRPPVHISDHPAAAINVPVVKLRLAFHAMGIVHSKNPAVGRIVQGEAVFHALRPIFGCLSLPRLDFDRVAARHLEHMPVQAEEKDQFVIYLTHTSLYQDWM
jgi:hypothetical protein